MKAIAPACFVLALLVLVVIAHAAVGDPKPIALKVRPLMSFEPSDFFVQIRVHPQPEDRWILVVADSGQFLRRSDWTIEPCQRDEQGNVVPADCRDRTLYTYWLRELPAGEYDLVTQIGHGDTIRASDRLTLKVIPRM